MPKSPGTIEKRAMTRPIAATEKPALISFSRFCIAAILSDGILAREMGLGALRGFCSLAGLELGEEQVEAFVLYRDALYRTNETANVTRVPMGECEVRHFIDSLLVAEFCPRGARVLDVGTGPGLPAWPLACARPDLRVTAMDSSGKMLSVLRACPLKNLSIRQQRAEEVDKRESFDVVTGRAIAPLAANPTR